MNRVFVVLSGIAGVIGVAFAAAAAHGGDASAHGPASQILLFHASALLALGLFGVAGRSGLLTAGGLVIAAGAFLFSGAVVAPYYLGRGLFPMAAPVGGTALMLGWALVVVGGVVLRTRD